VPIVSNAAHHICAFACIFQYGVIITERVDADGTFAFKLYMEWRGAGKDAGRYAETMGGRMWSYSRDSLPVSSSQSMGSLEQLRSVPSE
jgi:hypothetical protein